MPNASRVGDINQEGGRIVHGASTVYINGIPAGLHVSPITPHSPHKEPHESAVTTDACESVIIEGHQLIRVGSGNSCGHVIIQGSPDVFCP